MKTRQDNDVTEWTGAVYAKNETELSWSTNQVRSMMKTKYGNEVVERIGAFYVKNDIELSWPTVLSAICHKNQIG